MNSPCDNFFLYEPFNIWTQTNLIHKSLLSVCPQGRYSLGEYLGHKKRGNVLW